MRTVLAQFILLVVAVPVSGAMARGYGGGMEDQMLISNGQGVSSPGFWEGLKSANPAGLSYNQRMKFQGCVATFDSSASTISESAGVLGSVGQVGGGVEYSRFGAGPYGTGAINWGLATAVDAASLRLGVSGHHLNGASGSYDFGFLFDPSRQIRFGFLLPAIQNGLRNAGAGFTFGLDSTFDLVVDGAMDLKSRDSIVKPGLTLHADRFVVTGAYGFHVKGTSDPLLYSKFTAAIGMKITDHVLIEYSYRGLPEHLVGLTLR
ncbi:MAG: hypothetical protein EBX52_08370 [Proteobacteria bacterium]|nr:hypothetical protein [Pseudomonadota bacterium]